MVMTALPIIRAVSKSLGVKKKKTAIVWFSPDAKSFNNKEADALAKFENVVLVCGRYEGVDARVTKILKADPSRRGRSEVEEVSVGPYILTGGEVPALAIIDATARHIPGVLGKSESLEEGRVASHDVYTRPEVITHKGKKYRVPKVLLSGHHKEIEKWRGKRRSQK